MTQMVKRGRHPRDSRTRRGPFTARQALLVVAVGALGGSAAFWWAVERALTANAWVAAAYAVIMTLAPPALMAFMLPWSPAGMLLARVRARTWGTVAVVLCALVLARYAIQLQTRWWAMQPVVADSGLVAVQVLVGLIGFILIPALVWAPVTSDELVAQIAQAHIVARYEAQTQADLALLRANLLRAQFLAQAGFARLSKDEQAELAMLFRDLVQGIETTLDGLAASVTKVSGIAIPQQSLSRQAGIQEALTQVERVIAPPGEPRLGGAARFPASERQPERAALPADAAAGRYQGMPRPEREAEPARSQTRTGR